MSFLYDSDVFKNLINSLKNESLIKNAADPVVANNADFVVAKALADQLYSELKFEKPQPTITSGVGTFDVKMSTIKNFGTFMKNLADHKVMVDGNQLVYYRGEGGISKEQAHAANLDIVTTSPSGARDEENRKFESQSYYVNAKALRAYLESLKAMAEKSDSPEIIVPIVDTLIFNFNTHFRELKIDRAKREKGEGKEPLDISDSTIIDNIDRYYVFPDKPLTNPINPLLIGVNNAGGQAPYPVRIKDIKSSAGFNSFASHCTVHDANVGKSIMKRPEESEKLKCMLLNVLLKRSAYYVSNATDNNKKKIAIYYNSRIKSLMSEFTCEVSTGTGGKEDKEDKGESGEEKKDQNQWLAEISSNLPLSMDVVNVPRIISFVTEYNNFLGAYNKSAQSAVNYKLTQIKKVINSLNQMYNGDANNLIFNLKSPPVAFSTNLNGGIMTLATFLNALKNLVQYTSEVTMHMEHHFGKNLGNNLTRLRSQHSVIVRDNMDMLQSFIKNYATPKITRGR